MAAAQINSCNGADFGEHSAMQTLGNATRVRPVILAGGLGTRLAPISTPERPKPFVPLADGESLLTHTLRRVANPELFLPPILIGREADRFALLNHARAAGVAPQAILLEPEARNTGLAMAVITAYANQLSMHEIMVFLPADHWIEPVETWQFAIRQATVAAVQTQKLCLLGAKPTCFNPNYGYIELNEQASSQIWQEVAKFKEKPATESHVSGKNLWNMGQFVISPALLRDLYREHAREIDHFAGKMIDETTREWEFFRLPALATPIADFPSFDRMIVERTNAIVVPFEGQWTDLGTLDAWQNHTGLSVPHYARLPMRTDRPWGYFERMADSPTRVEKKLVVHPGARISRQRHFDRTEHWEVISGMATVEKNLISLTLKPGDSITIHPKEWHRLENTSNESLIIKEIQLGNPNESDIERSDDDYGRI